MTSCLSEEEFNRLGLTNGYSYSFNFLINGTTSIRATLIKELSGPNNCITALYLKFWGDNNPFRNIKGIVKQKDNSFKVPIQFLKMDLENITHPIFEFDTEDESGHHLKGGKRRIKRLRTKRLKRRRKYLKSRRLR